MKHPAHNPDSGALSKFEKLMAAALTLAAIAGVVTVGVSGSEIVELSRKQAVANQIVGRQLEDVRLTAWTQLSALPATPTSIAIPAALTSAPQDFSCSRTVTTVNKGLKQVTLTVSWQASTGRNYSRTGSVVTTSNGTFVAN